MSPPPAPAGWRFLPPLQRTVGSIELVSAPTAFPGRLAAWSDPSLVAPSIDSGRRLDGPSGIIELDGPERRGPTVSRALAPSTAQVVRAAPGAIGTAATDGDEEPVDDGADPAFASAAVPDTGTAEIAASDSDPDPEPHGHAAPTVRPAAERPASSAGPGAVAAGPVRPLAQRIRQAVERSVGGEASAAPEPVAPAPIRVQREAAAPAVVRSSDAHRSPRTPSVPSGGPEAADVPATATPNPISEPALDLPTATPPSTTSDSFDAPAPTIQRARFDPIRHTRVRAAAPADVVAAAEAPPRTSTSHLAAGPVADHVTPGVLQRVMVGPQAVRPVDTVSSPGRSELPMAPVRPSSAAAAPGPSALAQAVTLAEPLAPAEPTPQEAATRPDLSSVAPRAAATVVDLQRWTREVDAAPSDPARRLDRAPVSIGGSADGRPVGDLGPGRRPSPTLRIGEPSPQPQPVGGPALQRLEVARSWPEADAGPAAAHPQVLRPTGRVGSPVIGEDPVVQRAEPDGPTPAGAPPEPVPIGAPPPGGAPAASTTAGAAAAPPQAPTSREDLDRLAASLMPSLLWRIKAELVTERERRGVRSDRF